ncbi:MAG: mannitol dehydrogenase family protein, partial [Pseudomonadota bacterium]
GYSKMGIYIRPTLEACLAQGITPKAGYDCAASWVVFARRVYAGQLPMAYFEPFEEVLRPMLALGAEERLARDPVLWGDLPTKYAGFVPDLTEAIQQMEQTWQA